MSMDKHIPYILLQHNSGQITESEQLILNEWLEVPENRELFDKVSDVNYLNNALSRVHRFVMDMDSGRELVKKKIEHKRKIHRMWYRLEMAVSILFLLSAGFFFWYNKKEPEKNASAKVIERPLKPDVAPGSYKATLTLADGSQIVLDSAGQGPIAQQGGTAVINNADGKLVYKAMEANTGRSMLYNTLSTEKVQTYSVILPDGSKVWLNAGSSIKYPVAFDSTERRVTITGEAYFEVKKLLHNNGERVPFIVKVEDPAGKTSQEVEVLGTQFNINAYKEEKDIATTLLQGRVRIKNVNNLILDKPGQQGVLTKGTGALAKVKDVDVEKIVAWKNGLFNFERDSLATVIKQIAQWYDVDYVIDRRLSNKIFIGKIQRSMPLSKVLEKVSLSSGVPFIILPGKRLTISAKP